MADRLLMYNRFALASAQHRIEAAEATALEARQCERRAAAMAVAAVLRRRDFLMRRMRITQGFSRWRELARWRRMTREVDRRYAAERLRHAVKRTGRRLLRAGWRALVAYMGARRRGDAPPRRQPVDHSQGMRRWGGARDRQLAEQAPGRNGSVRDAGAWTANGSVRGAGSWTANTANTDNTGNTDNTDNTGNTVNGPRKTHSNSNEDFAHARGAVVMHAQGDWSSGPWQEAALGGASRYQSY